MSELILIRHGRSRGNTNGFVQGSDTNPANTLDELGVQQAQRLGLMLAEYTDTVQAAWSSPLTRARQTCDIALAAAGLTLPVTEDDRLREMCKGLAGLPGGMEGRPRELVKTAEYREAYRRGGWKFRHGSLESGGETAEEVGIRAFAAMNDIADAVGREATALVFAHGQSIRYGVGGALGWPDIRLIDAEYRLDNCEGVAMRRGDDRVWQVAGRLACA